MTLSSGQALARAHTPHAGSPPGNREAAAEHPGATTLRAARRAGITGTLVTAKSGGKAALPDPAATGGLSGETGCLRTPGLRPVHLPRAHLGRPNLQARWPAAAAATRRLAPGELLL